MRDYQIGEKVKVQTTFGVEEGVIVNKMVIDWRGRRVDYMVQVAPTRFVVAEVTPTLDGIAYRSEPKDEQ